MSYNLKYELDYEQLNENLFLYNRDDLNILTIAEKEDLNHFSCKTLLFYILSDLNHNMICDFNLSTHLTLDSRLSTHTIAPKIEEA